MCAKNTGISGRRRWQWVSCFFCMDLSMWQGTGWDRFWSQFLRSVLPCPSFRLTGRPPWISRIFRLVGLILIIAGLIWVIATLRDNWLPGTIAVTKAKQEAAVESYTHSKFSEAIEISNKGLRWAPMEWELYYDRAVGEALVDPPRAGEARADFHEGPIFAACRPGTSL